MPIETDWARGESFRDGGWPEPEPMALDETQPEPYPIHVLPKALRDAAEEVARFVKVPVASPAVIGVSVAAAAIGKKVRIEERPGLYHRPALFHCLIAVTGERKSPAFRHMTACLEEYEQEQEPAWKIKCENVAASNAVIEKIVAGLEREAKAEITTDERNALVQKIACERACLADPPPSPRLFTTDCTEQRLFQLMHERGGEFAVLSGEGRPVLDVIMGKYSGQGRTGEAIYLSGITGDNITRDRVGNERSGPEGRVIREPMLNVCVMVQPDKYLDLARHMKLREAGAIARIWPVWLPSLIGSRLEAADERGLNVTQLSLYNALITQILNTEMSVDNDGRANAHLIKLGPEAAAARRDWNNVIEGMMAEGQDLVDVRDIACKAVSATVKLAGIFHVLLHPAYLSTDQSEISCETWRNAQFIGEYHLMEAIRLQRMAGEDTELNEARRLIPWLADRYQNGFTIFKARDLQRLGPRPRPNAHQAEAVCHTLQDYGWILSVPSRNGERRPTYAINPVVANVANVARGGGET